MIITILKPGITCIYACEIEAHDPATQMIGFTTNEQ